MNVQKWHELNKEHVRLANQINRLFGGPETDDPEALPLIAQRSTIHKQKVALEEQMSDEEFARVYGS